MSIFRDITLCTLFIAFFQLKAQQPIINGYIALGLKSNLALKQKQASYEKSLLALKEAKGLFYPGISLNARFSVADGGRTIDFPIGDMLNPVYQNLNMINQQLFSELPTELQPDEYPLLENLEFTFLRPKEHETKITVVQPLVNSQIIYNKRIKDDLVKVGKTDMNAYKRQLIADIKSAYYRYLQSIEYIHLLDYTEDLIHENIRVNKKLYENHKVTIDNIYRAESEQFKLKKLQADAEKQTKVARSYFNFLINRQLDAIIEIDSTLKLSLDTIGLPSAQLTAFNKREELQQLEYYLNASDNYLKLNQFNALPSITGVVDYGYQGADYTFTSEYDYYMASVVLKWDLFKGLQNKQKIEQARVEKAIIETKKEEAKNQINLQVLNAYYSLEAAYKEIEASESEVKVSSMAFNIIRKKYNQGQSSLIEYIDARTSLTNARQTYIISKYNYYIKYADFERVACLTDLEKLESL